MAAAEAKAAAKAVKEAAKAAAKALKEAAKATVKAQKEAAKAEKLAKGGDERLTATALNKPREETMLGLLKNGVFTDDDISNNNIPTDPTRLRECISRIHCTHPTLQSSVSSIGDRLNKDFKFTDTSGYERNIELKSCSRNVSEATVVNRPWKGAVQFIQIMFNNQDPEHQPLLESFDVSALRNAWYNNVILKDVVPKLGISGEITCESYWNLAFKTSEAAETALKPKEPKNPTKAKKSVSTKKPVVEYPAGTRALFKALHALEDNDPTKVWLAGLWKDFLKRWLEPEPESETKRHIFDPSACLNTINHALQQKHYWLCLTLGNAYWVEGPVCKAITFKEIKHVADRKDSTYTPVYSAVMYKPSKPDDTYTIDMEFRLTWRNGGQGVHNLAVQIA